MKNLSLISTLTLLSLTISSCGYIHNHHEYHNKHAKYMEAYFKKADKNNDGFISKKEHKQCSNRKFSKMDLNKDLKISKEEMDSFKKTKWKNHHKKD